MSDAQHYRTKAEVDEYKKIDPISQVLKIIKDKKYATDAEVKTWDKEVKDKVEECQKFAEESPFPDKQLLYDIVYEQENYPFLKHR
jgi:pyruvate dehydrogenase E1 component alpha subunit